MFDGDSGTGNYGVVQPAVSTVSLPGGDQVGQEEVYGVGYGVIDTDFYPPGPQTVTVSVGYYASFEENTSDCCTLIPEDPALYPATPFLGTGNLLFTIDASVMNSIPGACFCVSAYNISSVDYTLALSYNYGPVVTPEPGFAGLLGICLTGLAILAHRRRVR
jgi:hypothetical protein